MATLKADIIEVRPRNTVEFDNTLGILKNGHDNLYPTRVEIISNASVSATQCTKVFAKFIAGAGFNAPEMDKELIGRDKKGAMTGLQVLKKCAYSIAIHKGVFIHVNYNLLGEVISVTPLPYRWCRFTQDDKEGDITGVSVYDNWDRSKGQRILKENIKRFSLYNPALVEREIEEAGGIAFYPGQVFFTSLDDNHIYPLATLDPALYDADTDGQVSVFKNKTIRNGFMGKTMIRVPEFTNERDKDDFKEEVKTWQGAENAETILLVEDEFTSEFPNGTVRIDGLDSKINDKLFENWEQSIPNKIRKCYNNIPPVLVDYVEGKLGDTSGESYKFAIDFYNSQTIEERMHLEEVLAKLAGPMLSQYGPVSIYPIQPLNTSDAPVN